jgi:hypothetical protein
MALLSPFQSLWHVDAASPAGWPGIAPATSASGSAKSILATWSAADSIDAAARRTSAGLISMFTLALPRDS